MRLRVAKSLAGFSLVEHGDEPGGGQKTTATPLVVRSFGGLGGESLFERLSLLDQLGNGVMGNAEHFAELR